MLKKDNFVHFAACEVETGISCHFTRKMAHFRAIYPYDQTVRFYLRVTE